MVETLVDHGLPDEGHHPTPPVTEPWQVVDPLRFPDHCDPSRTLAKLLTLARLS